MRTFRAAVLQNLSVACPRHTQRHSGQYIAAYVAFSRATSSNSQHLTETLFILKVNNDKLGIAVYYESGARPATRESMSPSYIDKAEKTRRPPFVWFGQVCGPCEDVDGLATAKDTSIFTFI